MKRSFEFLQLDPRKMLSIYDGLRLKKNTDGRYEIDTCSITFEQSLMLERVGKRNTVFTDELSKILCSDYDLRDTDLDFQYEAVFVDFRTLKDDQTTFASAEEALVPLDNKAVKEWIFLNGFSITGVPKRTMDAEGRWQRRPVSKAADTEVETIHYRAFVASASMARKGQVLFVNVQHYKALMERLTLDFYTFDESEKQLRMPLRNTPTAEKVYFKKTFEVQTAKFYSYLGLMLSDGASLRELAAVWERAHKEAFELPVLNHETVFLAEDFKTDAAPYYRALGDFAWVIEPTAGQDPNAAEKTFAAKLKPTDGLSASFNLFDGMGFCDNEYFDQFEALLLGQKPEKGKHPVNAIIIRLPWLKGVLVRADFKAFFEEQADRSLHDHKMKDVFDIERDLDKIHIIVGMSMMKGLSYLNQLYIHDTKLLDPWKYYWDRIHAYDISLLITGKNSAERTTERMNYQFLSTAGLSDDTIAAMCSQTADQIIQDLQSLKADRVEASVSEEEEALDVPTENTDAEEPAVLPAEGDGEIEHINTLDDLMAALEPEAQEKLRNTDYIHSAAQSYARSRLLDAMKGRLDVAGDYRFVAPDLLAYFLFLYDRYIVGTAKDQLMLKGLINTTEDSCIGHGYYYAPGKKAPWNRDGAETEIACLRNPHYALGEGVIVSPLIGERRAEYDRWFGHLFSVVMLPNTAVATMGGADFDGDRCLCVADNRLIGEMKKHIEENKAVLQYMSAHRNEYLPMLVQCSSPAAAKLQTWLKDTDYIPIVGEDFHFRKAACPPLIFGADGKALQFKCAEQGIETKIYKSFDLSTQQQVGQLSLLALRYSSKAYQVGRKGPACTDTDAWSDAQYCNLESWLWHWRMVSLGLENGMEIDMAKTGVRSHPAVLRENKSIRIDSNDPLQLAALFTYDTDANLLGAFRKLEEKTDKKGQTLRRMEGEAFVETLLHRLQKDNILRQDILAKSAELLQTGHNNVELLPYRMYHTLLQATKSEGSDLRLTFADRKGASSLRTFLRQRLGITGGNRPRIRDAETESCKNPTTMADLVWATDGTRAGVVERYLRHYLSGKPAPAFSDPAVLGDEQGIYFLKEIAKFLLHARQSEINNHGEAPMTPAALDHALHANFTDPIERLTYLLQYNGMIYDPVENNYKNIMNDHLLLALIGSDIHFFAQQAPDRKTVPDDEKRNAADALLRQFGTGRLERRNQKTAQQRLDERYRYAMRNLQRRFSLTNAIKVIKPYSGIYEASPLGQFGVPAGKLSRIFADMEEIKTEGEVE